MAIYHFSAKVISRANGSSALASAAYRSAGRLYDERLDRHHDFTSKSGVVHSEVLTPDNAPEVFHERERLWNAVEAVEIRHDAQLAREIEFAIPRELDQSDGIDLARDFVREEFVSKGMIADLNVHWDIGADGMAKPHAHVMLTMRAVDENGFGPKVREWNRTRMLEHWREAWGEHVNERLAELGIDVRIDHRSFQDQGIDLEPQHKIGPAAARMAAEGLEADRLDEHREIARENGAKIITNPSIALDAITHQQATFTRRDLAMFVHRHSDGLDQFNGVMAAVEGSPDLVRSGNDGRGEARFTSRTMLEVEERLHRAADRLAGREQFRVSQEDRRRALAAAEDRGLVLSREQRAALAHVTDGRDLGIVIGYAGTGKSAMLGVAKEVWEEAGFQVRGVALSGIAAENLESGSGIASRTIASLEHQWAQGRELLSPGDVLVIDEAGMVGSRQLERVLTAAEQRGAKIVLVGDPEQLQAIEAGAAFRSINERQPHVEITTIRRQHEDWQRDATRHLATGRSGEALAAYRDHGLVHAEQTRDEARDKLVDGWDRDRQTSPDKTRIILTHTNEEVQSLNQLARKKLRVSEDLGEDVTITVERGTRTFAPGDRVMALKNERGLGLKNGTLATVEHVTPSHMDIRLDDGRQVGFDLKDYNQFDHGYAATIHKAQGVTVDRVHVLATPGLDRHSAYVALSRHRERMDLHFGRDDFAGDAKLVRVLSRERAKDMASDYQRADPAQDYAERRGIPFREQVERVVKIVKQAPGKVRGMFDGLHLPAGPVDGATPAAGDVQGLKRENALGAARRRIDAPERTVAADPETALRQARTDALKRHARTVDGIFSAEDVGGKASPEQVKELQEARNAFEGVRRHGWRDAEAAYAKDPDLAREAGSGRVNRAIRALQLETELRTDPNRRADRFVERWQKLDQTSQRQYQVGDMSGYKATRSAMGAMAKSLERDPQLESLLANRKRDLGIQFETGRRLGNEIAFHAGIDLGRGRGIGL